MAGTVAAEDPLSKYIAAVQRAVSQGFTSSHLWSRSTKWVGKGTETVTALKMPMLNNWDCWGMRLLTWKISWDEEMSDFWRELGFLEAERWRQ